MGRHVNFQDEQDRWLNKANKLNRNKKKNKKQLSLLEKQFNEMITLKDQLEWIRLKKEQNERNK
jgi:hypothetical protein